jgi:hypothetical protein
MMAGAFGVVGTPAHAAGAFSGTVVGSDASPLAGATVMLVDEEIPVAPLITTTNADGSFSVADVPNGDWKVLVTKPGYAATFAGAPTYGAATSYVVTDGAAETVNVTLRQANAQLAGVVRDARGAAVADAQVNVSIPGPYIGEAEADQFTRTVTTDADGAFSVANLAPGNADVYVEAPADSGLVSEFWENVWGNGALTPVPLSEGGQTALDSIELEDGATIVGRVTTADGSPAAGVFVVASGSAVVEATTDADGNYRLFPVSPGDSTIVAISEDPNLPQAQYKTSIPVTAGSVYESINLVLGGEDVPPPPADTTPPTITCPSAPSFLLHDGKASITVDVVDAGVGVDTPTMTMALPADKIGDNAVTVEAADRNGNVASVSCGYKIGVNLVEVSFPTKKPAVRAFAGSNVPVVWRVVDANGRGVRNADHLVSLTMVTSKNCPARSNGRNEHREIELGKKSPVIKPQRLFGGYWIGSVAAPATKGCAEVQVQVVGDNGTAPLTLK